MKRERLDILVADRGLAPSRTAAAEAIRAGAVRLGRGGEKALKPSQLVAPDEEISLDQPRRYVSRGGEKLAPALDALGVDPGGRECLDVGASTGGFTDCLLQRGARRVVALDVGRGQLDWSLRNDPRVTVLEGRNARALMPGDLPYAASLVTIDVSFISLAKLLGAVRGCLAPDGEILALVKPQFELGPARVGKGGVVRDAGDRAKAIRDVIAAAERAGLFARGVARAGVEGPKGNRETFVHLAQSASPFDLDAAIAEAGV